MEEILREALRRYGIHNQTLMLCEECGELIQAANKALRKIGEEGSLENLKEEIADVFVMIEQVRLYWGIQWTDINDIYCAKVKRLKERMDGRTV